MVMSNFSGPGPTVWDGCPAILCVRRSSAPRRASPGCRRPGSPPC